MLMLEVWGCQDPNLSVEVIIPPPPPWETSYPPTFRKKHLKVMVWKSYVPKGDGVEELRT